MHKSTQMACRNKSKCLKEDEICIKPKAWDEHLAREHSKGLKNKEIIHSFLFKRSANAKKPATICRYARNRGRTHYRAIDKIENLCDWASNKGNQPLTSGNRKILRENVMRDIIGSGPNKFRNKNDITSDINNSRLYFMLRSIDKHYLGGSFVRKINLHTDSRPAILFLVRDEAHAGTCGTQQAYTQKMGEDPSMYIFIIFFRQTFMEGCENRRTDGISGGNTASKLEVLIICMCHELTHAIIELTCSEANVKSTYRISRGHGPHFRNMNYLLWGHAKTLTKLLNDGNPQLNKPREMILDTADLIEEKKERDRFKAIKKEKKEARARDPFGLELHKAAYDRKQVILDKAWARRHMDEATAEDRAEAAAAKAKAEARAKAKAKAKARPRPKTKTKPKHKAAAARAKTKPTAAAMAKAKAWTKARAKAAARAKAKAKAKAKARVRRAKAA